MEVSNCISHEWPFLNQWFRLVRILCLSKWLWRWRQMICSSRDDVLNLHATDVKETGQ